jgi:hypothetical protein
MGREQLRLRLRFVGRADLPDTEDLWAEPVDAHDGGGTYRLLNTSFVVPLGAGDTVRAAIDGRGRLQIVAVRHATQDSATRRKCGRARDT